MARAPTSLTNTLEILGAATGTLTWYQRFLATRAQFLWHAFFKRILQQQKCTTRSAHRVFVAADG